MQTPPPYGEMEARGRHDAKDGEMSEKLAPTDEKSDNSKPPLSPFAVIFCSVTVVLCPVLGVSISNWITCYFRLFESERPVAPFLILAVMFASSVIGAVLAASFLYVMCRIPNRTVSATAIEAWMHLRLGFLTILGKPTGGE